MIAISQPLPPIESSDDPASDLPLTHDPGTADNEQDSPPFPMHCLPGAAGDMAREIGRVTTAQNEPLAAATILATISASIGAGIEASTGGERRTRPNIFVCAIADSGTGKGETFTLAAEPFERAEAEVIQQFDMHTKPGLIAELRVAEQRSKKLCTDAAKESDCHARHLVTEEYRRAAEEAAEIQRRIESAPRWKVGDITREALAIVMAGQPGEALASMSSEARGLFSIIRGKYSKEGGDEDFYCSAYSGDSVTVDRVGRPRVTLRRPCLSVLWMLQPDAARKALSDEAFVESGLIPRFLMFDPKAEPQERTEQPAPIPAPIKEAWGELIRALILNYRMLGSDPATVSVSHEALAILTDYERENVRRRRRSGDLRDIASFVARWTENGWKIALILHAAKHGGETHLAELTATTAENAVEVMRWFSERQLEILNVGRHEKLQKRLLALSAVLAEAKGEITFRQLRRSNGFEDGEIRQLLAMFPNRFRIEKRKPDKGRPSLWVVRVA
jgi:hypothetical protein